jgi:type I restriction enzyme M protein
LTSSDESVLDSGIFQEKLGPEEKTKQEKVIPYLRDVLGFKLMDFEVPIRFGRMTKFADIVVSIVENNRRVPYLIVECKAPNGIKADDWLQAESYAQRLGAGYFIVTDGSKEGWAWYRTGERQGDSVVIESSLVPHMTVKKEGESLVKFDDISSLGRIVQQCHDVIRNEEGRDPAESFDEMSKLLFAKMKDERDVEEKKKTDHDFRIISDSQGKIVDTPSTVAERVVQLFELAKHEFPKIYSEVESKSGQKLVSINIKHNTIYQIVGILSPYTLLETKTDSHGLDIKGTTFETFLKGTFRGPLGQFFTPREITDFMVSIVDVKGNELVLDPACGSGGFLIACMKKVDDELEERYRLGKIDDLDDQKKQYAENNLFGMDINERMAWVAKMNMVFHGDGHGGIVCCNSFTITTRNEDVVSRRYRVILTNPPFGSKISDPKILSDPRLKDVSRAKLTEVLYLGLSISLLEPHGRLGIVLPDGVLTNSTLQFVRDFIKRETIVKAIISLPNEAFMPFGAGAKASLVFLEKIDPKNPYHVQGPVFMALASNIGYDATGRKTENNDFDSILAEYRKFEEKHYRSI